MSISDMSWTNVTKMFFSTPLGKTLQGKACDEMCPLKNQETENNPVDEETDCC